ncbi:MAG: alkaline phosphatase family protein [Alphaproteobacteria bacterium]|nr:alkaline phosphatase family protein [Alphaproteobacteria bacterium]
MIAPRFMQVLLTAILLAACTISPSPNPHIAARGAATDIVILVSIDGFRPDYLDRGVTPTLSRLAAEGARASMRPAFPSVTFPNHYALVTGRTPDHNGMVNNRMEDPQRPGVTFTIGDKLVSADPVWWDDATPIWATAQKQGVMVGTMFWPGSDFQLKDGRPSLWRAFDQTLPGFARVDNLLAWLDLPAAQRPALFTLYFDLVDTAGHRYGPDSADLNSAAAEVDAAMTRLMEGLRVRGLDRKTNLIVVADHGMTEVSADRIIELDAAVTPLLARVVWDGAFAGIAPLAGREAEAERALLGRKDHGECWRKGEIPARFGYGTHRRVPAIICLADVGWFYRSSQLTQYSEVPRGNHGYDPAAKEMAAIFIAHGPAIRRGVVLPDFPSVSVYELVAKLAGVTPEPNDGSADDTRAALAGGR